MTDRGTTSSLPPAAVHAVLGLGALVMCTGSLANWLAHLQPPEGMAEGALLAAAVALMAGVVLLALWRPFWSVGAFFLAVPLLNVARKWVAIDSGSATVPSSVLLWVLLLVVLVRIRPTSEGVRLAGLAGPLVVYLGAGFTSVLAAVAIGVPESRAAASAVTGILEPVALLYLTYLCSRLGGETGRTLRGLVYGAAGCVALWAILYRFGAGQTAHAAALDDPGVIRSLLGSMTFGSALHFSMAALVAVPLAFLDEAHPSGARRVLRLVVLALLLLGLGVGFSRGALLALMLELFVLVRWRIVPRGVVLAFLPAVALAFALLFGNIVLMRMADLRGAPAGDLTTADISRFEAWRVAATSILHYPLGIGGGNFDFAWRRWSGFTVLFEDIGGPHNLWLSLGSEYGLPFLLAFVALAGTLLGAALHVGRRAASPPARRLGFALAAAVAGFLAAGTVGDAELSHLSARNKPMNTPALFLFSVFGLIVARRQAAGEAVESTGGSRPEGRP